MGPGLGVFKPHLAQRSDGLPPRRDHRVDGVAWALGLPFSLARACISHRLPLPDAASPRPHFQLFCTNVITEQWASQKPFPGPAGVPGLHERREAGPQGGLQMVATGQGLSGGDGMIA